MSWCQFNLQNGASPVMEEMIFFHDHLMTLITTILSLIMYLSTFILSNKFSTTKILDNQKLETMWTTLPAMILSLIAIPSMYTLYLTDEYPGPLMTIKITGNQWFWSYEYADFPHIDFDSYMLPTKYLSKGMLRLLEVDLPMIIPMKTTTRLLITSSDVLHSWTIPSLGIKADAIPGRLNSISLYISRPGIYYGQCSEICGADHSFMPITIESIPTTKFLIWLLHCYI